MGISKWLNVVVVAEACAAGLGVSVGVVLGSACVAWGFGSLFGCVSLAVEVGVRVGASAGVSAGVVAAALGVELKVGIVGMTTGFTIC